MSINIDSPKKTPTSKTKSGLKKNLININSKKKKKLFNELSFVESHVDTFYVGLNENYQGAHNPVKAKCINIDEAPNIAKDWVHPDSQLVRSHIKTNKTISRSNRTRQYKPLQFVNGPIDSNQNNSIIKDNIDDYYDILEDERFKNEKCGLLSSLFDDVNTTQMNDRELTVLTPNRYKVFVQDTPDCYYGLSILERRQKGLDN